MTRSNSMGLLWASFLILALTLYGCSGGNSGADDDGDAAPLVAQTFNEDCALCHRATSIADVAEVHSKDDNSPQGQITAVNIVGGTVTVNFRLFESTNNAIPLPGVAANDIRFTIAKLVPGAAGDADAWQSYINSEETVAAGDPATRRTAPTHPTVPPPFKRPPKGRAPTPPVIRTMETAPTVTSCLSTSPT